LDTVFNTGRVGFHPAKRYLEMGEKQSLYDPTYTKNLNRYRASTVHTNTEMILVSEEETYAPMSNTLVLRFRNYEQKKSFF
jgi:hypothetical protein